MRNRKPKQLMLKQQGNGVPLHEIKWLRPKPGKTHASAVRKEWSTQMTAALGEAWWNKTHFSEAVGCQGIVCASPRGVRGGQHGSVSSLSHANGFEHFTSNAKPMFAACWEMVSLQASSCGCSTSPAVSVTPASLGIWLSWKQGGSFPQSTHLNLKISLNF